MQAIEKDATYVAAEYEGNVKESKRDYAGIQRQIKTEWSRDGE